RDKKGFELAQPLLRRVVVGKPGRTFELRRKRVERAVLMVRLCEIAQPCMSLASDLLGQGRAQARFADSRLARDQHDPALALLRLAPAPQQQLDLLVAPYKRRCSRAQCLETAQHAALGDDPPGALRLGEACDVAQSEILDLKQTAELLPRAVADDNAVG